MDAATFIYTIGALCFSIGFGFLIGSIPVAVMCLGAFAIYLSHPFIKS